MSLFIELNGVYYSNWNEASVSQSMENMCSSFNFSTSVNANNLFPIKTGDRINIIADEEKILSGFVEEVDVQYGPFNHTITISGRSTLADFVDSTVGETKEFTGALTLKTIAEILLADIGLSDIEVIDQADSSDTPFSDTDIESAAFGETCFEFLEKYARKQQVFITSDKDGNLVLLRADIDADPFPIKLKNKVGAIDNNIIGASFKKNIADRFYSYNFKGSLNPLYQDSTTTPEDISSQESGEVYDEDIRDTRIIEIIAEESSDSEFLKERAIWERNVRIARSLSYSAIVQGHTANGNLWVTNTLVDVDDDFSSIHEQLFIRKVIYTESITEGSTTIIEATYKDAYTIIPEVQTDDVGEEW